MTPESNGSSAPLAIFKAPNGLNVFHHTAAETKYVYEEIFEDRVYFQHGINLTRGETVFDIGANIGLFTMFVSESFEEINVCAFEPSPVILPILKANVAKYGDSVSVYDCGIAGRAGQAVFTFYPRYSIMSGFHTEDQQDRKMLRAAIESHLRQQGMDIQERFLKNMVNTALDEKQEHVCQLRTLSDIINEAGIEAVGLLKIDAEGSELDILAGIRDEHWPRIRQIVAEIHDPKGTICSQIQKLLRERGYVCVFEQEKRLSGSGIVNCYARRS